MKILAMILLVAVFVYSVIEMNTSSKVTNKEEYKALSSEKRKLLVEKLKNYWRINIIGDALTVGIFLVVLSTFLGGGSNLEMQISITGIITSLLFLTLIIYSKKMFYKYIEGVLYER